MTMEFHELWWLEFITYPELDDEKPNKKTEFSSKVDRPDFIFKHHVLISRILSHILWVIPSTAWNESKMDGPVVAEHVKITVEILDV